MRLGCCRGPVSVPAIVSISALLVMLGVGAGWARNLIAWWLITSVPLGAAVVRLEHPAVRADWGLTVTLTAAVTDVMGR